MSLILFMLMGIALLFIGIWCAGVWYLNDYTVPRMHLKPYKRALVVFPHPDDETNVAGLLWRLHRLHTPITLAVLTKGECGTPDAHMEPKLKQIRSAEMQRVSQLLGAQSLHLEDFGDGQVAAHREQVRTYLEKLLAELQPDLVITYDLAGMYGHEDHITCTEVITELVRAKYPDIELWYSALPAHLLRTENLPTHMAKDPDFASRRARANLRVPIGVGIIAKVRAVYVHKSQRLSFQKSAPAHLPVWLAHSMLTNEYFEKVQ